MKIKTILVLILVLVLCAVSAGCSASSTGEDKNTTNVEENTNVEAGEYQAELSDGNNEAGLDTSADQEAEIPKDYPSDILPVYEGSYIYLASKIDEEDAQGYQITFSSTDECADVEKFYKDIVKNYDEVEEAVYGDTYNISAQHGEYKIIIALIAEADQPGYKSSGSIAVVKRK